MRIQVTPINTHVTISEKESEEEECPPTEPYPNGEPPIFNYKQEKECDK